MGTLRHFGRSSDDKFAQQRALLAALSDDLALPLLQIKTSLELLKAEQFAADSVREKTQLMTMTAEIGLQLVEAYRLALVVDEDLEISMEPVSIGAILQDVAHDLTPYAKQYTTELFVDVQGKLAPVLAHRESLIAALQCLGASIIRAQAAQGQQDRYELVFGAHRTANNVIATGVFSQSNTLSDRTLRAARGLVGQARLPLQNVPAGAASGVLIADMLCTSMWQPLRLAAHRNMSGLATSVPLSKQLSFV
jgi:hypothetical protein